MATEVNETIKVRVIFGYNKKKLKPVWFIWRGRKHTVARKDNNGIKGLSHLIF